MAFTDFFKPHWKHSNPAVRAASIRLMEEDQQALLLSLALGDGDTANRLAAARKVKEPELLKKLRDQTQDKAIKEFAQKQWVESQIVVAKAIIKDANDIARSGTALDNVADDQRALEDIARNAASLEIRNLAFPKLIHASAFQAIALGENDDALALKALAKITREGHLETLAKSANSKVVKIAAKERLKSLESSKGPSADTINRAKLGLVLKVAERASALLEGPASQIDWEKTKVQLDEAEIALAEITAAGAVPEASKQARFRESVASFRAQFARWNQERVEKEQKLKQAAENLRLKDEVCTRLEAILNEGGATEVVDAEGVFTESPQVPEIRALREQFLGLGVAGEGMEGELQKRFRSTMEKLERRAREQESLARRQADEKEHGGRLSALCEQAIALAQLSPAQALERFRDLRKEWNKAINASGPFAGREELRARFEAAVASTQASLEELRNTNLARMRDLLPELEGLLETPDMLVAEKNFKVLNGEWKSLHPAPVGPEAEGLHGRYLAFMDRFREAQDWLRWSNLRSKQTICDKLEALVLQEDRKAMVAHLKELQAEWKALGPVPWENSEALWDRYNTICNGLYEKCREYFAELDVERESNLKVKEDLCTRMEALVALEDIDWRDAMETVKEAQGTWMSLGAVPKAQSEAIWIRFRTVCNAFFDRKDKNNEDNLARKMLLVELAESLQDSTEWKATGIQIKDAQEKWKTIGPVPRDQSEPIWQRFHGACEKFFLARRGFMEKLDQEKPMNLAKKEALCVTVESLDNLPGDAERFECIKEAQAAWKETGPAPRELEDALWERFRKPIDAYFELRKARFGEEKATREENAKIKEDICIEAESIANSIEWKATIDKIKSLQERWKATGPAPRELDRDLWKRFRTACDGFFDRLKENSAKRDTERGGNLDRKIDLCFIAEMMVSTTPSEAEAEARAKWSEKKLPIDIERFRLQGIDWNDNTEKIKALQREWKKIGPVPREVSDSIWERFHTACDAFFEERRIALGLPAEDPQISLEKKLDLISEVESLAQNPGDDAISRVRNLQREWRRIGAVPKAQSDYVWKRFTDACDLVLGGQGNIKSEIPA
jgi:hypothetical protein